MTTLAIELNDAGLLAADGSGIRGEASPGYALADGKTVVTGRAAAERARLKPRRVHHRFWHELDTTPLPRPFPRGLTAADLAHAHLSEVWRAAGEGVESVILAIPGSFSERRLGLALGVARSCGMPVEGMVDAALAAAVTRPGHRLLHLDAHLHRVVLTEMAWGDGDLSRRRVEVIDDAGLVALHDALARRVARLFVYATRFDPLHSAASEQKLYGRLPEWLDELRRDGVTTAAFDTGSKEHEVEMALDDVVPAVDAIYASILDAVRSARCPDLLLSYRVAELPGFEARLAGLRGVRWATLPAGAAAAGALAAEGAVAAPGEEALPFVVRLPVELGELPDEPEEGEPAAAAPALPTHVLDGGFAYPITAEPVRLERHELGVYRCGGRVVVDGGGAEILLNGARVEGISELAVGDRLHAGGAELRLIAVVG